MKEKVSSLDNLRPCENLQSPQENMNLSGRLLADAAFDFMKEKVSSLDNLRPCENLQSPQENMKLSRRLFADAAFDFGRP